MNNARPPPRAAPKKANEKRNGRDKSRDSVCMHHRIKNGCTY